MDGCDDIGGSEEMRRKCLNDGQLIYINGSRDPNLN
jgi:hypothetical protein